MLCGRISSESGLCSLQWRQKCMDVHTSEHLLSIALAGKGDTQILPLPFPVLAVFAHKKCQCPTCLRDSLANSTQTLRDTPNHSGKPSLCGSSGPSWESTPSACKGAGGKHRHPWAHNLSSADKRQATADLPPCRSTEWAVSSAPH